MGPFPTRWVCGAGAPDFPHTLAAIGVKATDVDLSAFAAEGAQWAARQGSATTDDALAGRGLIRPDFPPLPQQVYRRNYEQG